MSLGENQHRWALPGTSFVEMNITITQWRLWCCSSSSWDETRTSSKRWPACMKGPWIIPSNPSRGSRTWIYGNSSAGMGGNVDVPPSRNLIWEPQVYWNLELTVRLRANCTFVAQTHTLESNQLFPPPLLRKKTQLQKVKRTLDIEERMLFHGTGYSNIQAICTFNFDWRLTGSHGGVYGKGKSLFFLI